MTQQPRIRQAQPGDALVVAALTLQCARHRGSAPEPGFLDRFADQWAREQAARPVWIAEHRGEHAAYLQAAVVRALPWPGRSGGGWAHIEEFFVRPDHRGAGIGEALVRACVEWGRRERLGAVRMSAGPHTRPMVERVGFRRPGPELLELPLAAP